VGLEIGQVRQLKQAPRRKREAEKLVTELGLDKAMLQDVLAKNSKALAPPPSDALLERRVSNASASRVPHGPDRRWTLRYLSRREPCEERSSYAMRIPGRL
jgi:hypothetical protein